MTSIPAINTNAKTATYNAVKIQINEPQANINDNFKTSKDNNGTYNAVAIEVNRPRIEAGNKHHSCYEYPCAECVVTSNHAPIHNIKVPKLPATYQTTNIINNKTLINAPIDLEKELNNQKALNNKKNPETKIVIEKTISVPKPNVVKVEDQKLDIQNKAETPNFKAEKKTVEIIPSVEIKPSIDIPQIIKNLSDNNFDIQAQQMEDIAKVSMEDPQKAVPYIVTEVFAELINIVKKDTTGLTPPSQEQIELRKQIIVNEIIKEKAKSENKDVNSIELPYQITEKDFIKASELSPLEQAERNKEYGLYTISILSKVYTDEILKHTGNVVPLTDLPGISDIVDALRFNSNPSIKIAAIDALRYLNRPEYKEEIKSVLEIASNDSDVLVAKAANKTLQSL